MRARFLRHNAVLQVDENQDSRFGVEFYFVHKLLQKRGPPRLS
jgi:hypothetical protein